MFKIGDIVNVVDLAWSQVLNVEDEVRVRQFFQPGTINTFRVIGINCKIPILPHQNNFANTLIQNTKSETIFAINACNIFLHSDIKVQFVSNGQDITDSMSEQSRRAVLKANNY